MLLIISTSSYTVTGWGAIKAKVGKEKILSECGHYSTFYVHRGTE